MGFLHGDGCSHETYFALLRKYNCFAASCWLRQSTPLAFAFGFGLLESSSSCVQAVGPFASPLQRNCTRSQAGKSPSVEFAGGHFFLQCK